MKQKKDEMISAQVVLRSASGARSTGQVAVTSENVHEFAPSSETIASATGAFKDAGFEVGNVVGNSVSITAPASTFEKVFKSKIQREESHGKARAAHVKGPEIYELSVNNLSPEVAKHVEAVTFSAPPEFGPGNF